ncbi:hypothetical protein ACP3WW_23085, partial [Salmonella enterica]|uniref:hypothetical protein n=1 Tax=Salmonella enterica TaxID=28901 RepID=UPI003CE94025
NIFYGYKLVNLNDRRLNNPGLDLGDDAAEIAFHAVIDTEALFPVAQDMDSKCIFKNSCHLDKVWHQDPSKRDRVHLPPVGLPAL